MMIKSTTRKTGKYIRLSPTVLYSVPLCYAAYTPRDDLDTCIRCVVRRRCEEKQETVRR